MESGGGGGSGEGPRRWTCDACGCNTNDSEDNPTTCSICGSRRRSMPELFQRAERSLSAHFLGRGILNARRGAGLMMGLEDHFGQVPEDLDFDLPNDPMSDDDNEGAASAAGSGDDQAVMASFAMDAAGVRDAARPTNSNNLSRGARVRRLIRSASVRATSNQRSNLRGSAGINSIGGGGGGGGGGAAAASGGASDSNSPAQGLRAEELMQRATDNASLYQPAWANLVMVRSRESVPMEIGCGSEFGNVALVPVGSCEGRAIRAHQPLPRGNQGGSQDVTGRRSVASRNRPIFGFKVCFSRPNVPQGSGLGGRYFVGVTTQAFAGYQQRNGLQQSSLFWGIEDRGHKFEGPNGTAMPRGFVRRSSSDGQEIPPRIAPRNTEGMLFGNREVVTVILDVESRSLSFWRSDTFLGTLVHDVPRSGLLYPVAVPYNTQSTVVITGLDGNPLDCLGRYEQHRTQENEQRNLARRSELDRQRQQLIYNGSASPRLLKVLEDIFGLYCEAGRSELSRVIATRLWYRCGFKLSHLDSIWRSKGAVAETGVDPHIAVSDFVSIITDLIREDCVDKFLLNPSEDVTVRFGDVVELAPEYEQYGDSLKGPMQPGDRGRVVEVQSKGQTGERHSIRVLYNGRRWWYQPQALISERSGLVATPTVWFIRKILRSHGYDADSLEPLWGKAVAADSAQVGDLVVPEGMPATNQSKSCFGRVTVPPPNAQGRGVHSLDRQNGLIPVEVIDENFARMTGISLDQDPMNQHCIRKVQVDKLVFAGPIIWTGSFGNNNVAAGEDVPEEQKMKTPCLPRQIKDHFKGIAELQLDAILAVSAECTRSPNVLLAMFDEGLDSVICAGIEKCLSDNTANAEAIRAIGKLCVSIAKRIYNICGEDSRVEKEQVSGSKRALSSENHENEDELEVEYSRDNPEEFFPSPAQLRQLEDSTEDADMSSRGDLFLALLAARSRLTDNPSIVRLMEAAGGSDLLGADEPTISRQQGLRRILHPAEDRDRSRLASFLSNAERVSRQEALSRMSQALRSRSQRAEGSSPEARLRSMHAGMRHSSSEADQSAALLTATSTSYNLLRTVRRGGFDAATTVSSADKGTLVHSWARVAIENGIKTNTSEWIDWALNVGTKRRLNPSMDPSKAVRLNPSDEDGTSLLLLAISLGCSPAIIRFFLESGAYIGSDEIERAAYTDQPLILSLLLQNIHSDDIILDVERCTERVRIAVEIARSQQQGRKEKTKVAAESLLSKVLLKLLQCGLSCRRGSEADENCFSEVARALTGPVLMKAMNANQKSGRTSNRDDSQEDESGRVPLFHSERSDVEFSTPSSIASTEGLLFLLPDRVVTGIPDSPEARKMYSSVLMRFVEACLWEKKMEHIASGLVILSLLIERVPGLRSPEIMSRYAFKDLIACHERSASHAIAKIEKSPKVSESVLGSTRCRSSSDSGNDAGQNTALVCCPKSHVAQLHVTKHSSFRCDLCGKGVDYGSVMYGCRDCDWDACEECIDGREGAFVKWHYVRKLAEECLVALSKDDADSAHQSDVCSDDRCRIYTLAELTRRRDPSAFDEIGVVIANHERMTMFEFASVLLPALHEAVALRVMDETGEDVAGEPNPVGLLHRDLKRPRVAIDEARAECLSTSQSLDRETFCHRLMDSLMAGEGAMEDNRPPLSRLVYRIHEIIAFLEERAVLERRVSGSSGRDVSRDEKGLHQLTLPFEIELIQIDSGTRSQQLKARRGKSIHVEPLMPVQELELHILRTSRSGDDQYENFCQDLVGALILERAFIPGAAVPDESQSWSLARVLSYDNKTGAHRVNYAESVDCSTFSRSGAQMNNSVRFGESVGSLVLSGRDYIILQDACYQPLESDQEPLDQKMGDHDDDWLQNSSGLAPIPAGTRVERKVNGDDSWDSATIMMSSRLDRSRHGGADVRYDLVTDTGEVIQDVDAASIRTILPAQPSPRLGPSNFGDMRPRLSRSLQDGSQNQFRRRELENLAARNDEIASQAQARGRAGVMKRTWSALSPLEEMCPVDLKVSDIPQQSHENCMSRSFCCDLNGNQKVLDIDKVLLREPMRLSVELTTDKDFPATRLSGREITTYEALKWLHERAGRVCRDGVNSEKLYFRFRSETTATAYVDNFQAWGEEESWCSMQQSKRPVTESLFNHDRKHSSDDSWFDPLSIQCMDVLSVIGRYLDESEGQDHKQNRVSLESLSLTSKLMMNLEDPLTVVTGGLPKWCVSAPCRVPMLFSFASRRLLLEKIAFGVSRSVLRQQEEKVNVTSLRQRMATLRGRAVELVGEAFSGGAEDPTALQLQAEELYGMEETLAARVRAAFRAQKWEERSLECAKAAIRRDRLLADAAAVMDRYTRDFRVRRRRLEVRFDGESGFDAASGDQAGVTRGFYADVAEELLSCRVVSSIQQSSQCAVEAVLPVMADTSLASSCEDHPYASHEAKLPLWIPHFDSSQTTILPTPRAGPTSSLGVFPRPLAPDYPRLEDVKQQFRFMGRVFAGAMRDGFMFPLPLSCSFLKLVQNAPELYATINSNLIDGVSEAYDLSVTDDVCVEETSLVENNPYGCSVNEALDNSLTCEDDLDTLASCGITSRDLPRPGFLGGEVFGVESFICKALDQLDKRHPRLSAKELEHARQKISADSAFAREALGKSFDCSFEDYFEDRTFVDPLDPSQGELAAPLCDKGHMRSVNIHNVREWVFLCKKFILVTGVIEQAMAFRQGVEDLFPAKYLSLFTAQELQSNYLGVGDNVDSWTEDDIQALFHTTDRHGFDEASAAVAAMGGGFGPSLARRFDSSSQTMKFLRKTLMKSSPNDRRSFLSFVTSVPISRKGMGKIEVVPLTSASGEFLPMKDPTCLPRANTCARRLYLPKFKSFESFEQVLWAVVRQECKFKGFYEWRG